MRARIKASAAAWVCAFGGGWAAAPAEETLISMSSRGDPKSARQLVKTGELAAPSTTSSRTDHIGLHVSTEGAEEVQPPSIQHQEGGAVSPGDRIEGMDEDWTGHASTSPAGAGAVLENARSVYAELSGEILVGVRGCDHALELRNVMLPQVALPGSAVTNFGHENSWQPYFKS